MQQMLALSAHLPEDRYAAGEVIVREGDRTGGIWVLVSGALAVRKGGIPVNTITPGALVGEISVLLNSAFSATVEVVEPAVLRFAADGEAFLGSNPGILRLVAVGLAGRLNFVTTYLADLKHQYGDAPGLTMVPGVLRKLALHRNAPARPGSARDPDPNTERAAPGRSRRAGAATVSYAAVPAAREEPFAIEHKANIQWTFDGGDFRKGRYSRAHRWTFDGGLVVPASPSPHVVPAPWSEATAADPEEAFVAAIASCHMLTFLFLASRAGHQVLRYEDDAVGTMVKNDRGRYWVNEVVLRPRIEWGGERGAPGADEIERLHHDAHEECFIANSVRTLIRVEPPSP